MHSAFNQLVFHNSMFAPFFLYDRAMCSMEKFLFLPLIFANAFCFHALSWFIDT